jgi:hypothetical protein
MYTDGMTGVRQRMAPIAIAWLLCQTATMALVPAVLFATGSPSALECTCLHDSNHDDCPMHHAAPVEGQACVQGMGDDGVAVFASLLGQAGLVPHTPDTIFLTRSPLAVTLHRPAATLRPAPPEPPPPRA